MRSFGNWIDAPSMLGQIPKESCTFFYEGVPYGGIFRDFQSGAHGFPRFPWSNSLWSSGLNCPSWSKGVITASLVGIILPVCLVFHLFGLWPIHLVSAVQTLDQDFWSNTAPCSANFFLLKFKIIVNNLWRKIRIPTPIYLKVFFRRYGLPSSSCVAALTLVRSQIVIIYIRTSIALSTISFSMDTDMLQCRCWWYKLN